MSQFDSTQNDASPLNSPEIQQPASVKPHSRLPFRREKSWTSPGAKYHNVPPTDQDVVEADETSFDDSSDARGLGLSNIPQSTSSSVVKRKPISSTSSPEPFSQATTAQNSGNNLGNLGFEQWTASSSRYSLPNDSYSHTPDNINLIAHDHDHHHHGPEGCPTQGDVLKESWTWFTILVIIMAIYSWIFSAIFLAVAIARPRWGHRIGTPGAITYDAATLLSALLSKLVELTFATTFVATLGQILSRRAFPNVAIPSNKRGISIAEMNMRLWIMQPGTLVTHFDGVKYVITSILGITALAAAFAAAFYTTAAEALVSPKIKFGPNETVNLFGQVSASYANFPYLSDTCETPISTTDDPLASGDTCLQVSFAGNGFRNMRSWSSVWKGVQLASENLETAEGRPRPPPTSILYDNTTVQGAWIRPSGENITADSERYGRLVQNATIVMPHANVFHAARDPKNRILQPDDLQGLGQYFLNAAVPSPGLNTLCVGASEEEIRPIIGNITSMPQDWPNVETPLDPLFNWSSTPDNAATFARPLFGKFPEEFNTIGNTTNAYGSPWIYLIAKPPTTTVTNDYVICGLRSFQYTDCSTSLSVAKSGSELAVHCGNSTQNWKSYNETLNATEAAKNPIPAVQQSKDWKDIGIAWIRAVALTQGISDANASSARYISQLTPAYSNGTPTKLSLTHPSIAEALCVLAGHTLLQASDAAPFVHYWDYSPDLPPRLDVPALEGFQAILSYKDYASGGDQQWKGVFYVILAAVFVMNTFCLGCLLYYYGLYGEVTDYTEPQNLFALAINSPPTQMLAGACGAGPSGQMLNKKWCVDMSRPTETPNPNTTYDAGGNGHEHTHNNQHPHFYVRYPEEEPLLVDGSASAVVTPATPTGPHWSRLSGWFSPSPDLTKRKNRKSFGRTPPTVQFEVDDSPAIAQYKKLTGR